MLMATDGEKQRDKVIDRYLSERAPESTATRKLKSEALKAFHRKDGKLSGLANQWNQRARKPK